MSSLPDAFPTSPNQHYRSMSDSNGSIAHCMVAEDVQEEPMQKNRPTSMCSDDKVPLSWQSLSSLIAHAIHNLKESVRQRNSAFFAEDTTAIVHRIRLLLYASNCLEKETSIYLKSNKHLRNQHRTLLAAVAKLVLSTKIASSAWPTPESLAKLQSDAEDILVAVRNFMTGAQELQIEIKEGKPSLTNDPNRLWCSLMLTKIPTPLGRSDLVTATTVLADNVRGAMSSFMDSVRDAYEQKTMAQTLAKLKANAPLLVAQFRNLSNTTSNFLNAVEEFGQMSQIHLPLLVKSKQPIYTAMGSLFVVSQTMTSADLDGEQVKAAFEKLEECVHTIETGLMDVVDATHKQMDELPENENQRNTPTPTQRQFAAPRTVAGSPLHDTDGFLSEEEDQMANNTNVRQIGLNTAMSNSTLLIDSGMLTDETINESSGSLNSDGTAYNASSMQVKKEAKIQKFFGEDTIQAARLRDTLLTSPTLTTTPSIAPSTNTSGNASVLSPTTGNPVLGTEVPWYLSSDVDPSEMIFDMEGNAKGGSLHGLVQRMTNHDHLGTLCKNMVIFLRKY